MKPSKKFSLNSVDWKSIGMGALKVMLGALLTYLAEIVPGIDFGAYTPTVMFVFTTLLNIVWKWLGGKTAK